jgi:alkylation response protein AidB-like acyl-CoA dehydrogenase
MKAAWEKIKVIVLLSSMAKLYASKHCDGTYTVEAVQIHGGNGFVNIATLESVNA